MSPLSQIFFEILTSDRYHRDMTVFKILASNSKHFRIYGTFNKLQIGVPWLMFQTTSGLENSPGYVF